jgi:hypothetical protein
LATLDFQSTPKTGERCRYCPAALICPARHKEANQLSVPLQELPTGIDAARLLETIIRVEAVFDEIKSHYRSQLGADPPSFPGWRLQSSARRWVPTPSAALATMISDVSVAEFLDSCATINVGNLERLCAEKNNIAPTQVRKQFDRYFNGVVQHEAKRSEPAAKSQLTPCNSNSNSHQRKFLCSATLSWRDQKRPSKNWRQRSSTAIRKSQSFIPP